MQYRNILWAVVIFIAGCASAPDAGPMDVGSNDTRTSEATFAVQGKSYDEVWSAVERVAGQTLTIVDSNKAFGTLKAVKGVLMGPWGSVVIFSVRPAHNDAAEYSVSLESINKPESTLPTDEWARTMVIKIKSELGQ